MKAHKKLPTNYLAHEARYVALKNEGAPGWGGEVFNSRMQTWDLSIKELCESTDFPAPPATLLELGSGTGDVALKFACLGYKVFGVDISNTAVEWAKENAKSQGVEAKFYQGDVCNLTRIDSEKMQIVIDGNCLHCVIGDDRARLLKEVHRVLSVGGVFYVSTRVGEPKLASERLQFDTVSRCQIENGIAYRYMGLPEDILRELRLAGFEIVSVKVQDNPWWQNLFCLARKV